jgi:hypothetical protein
MATKNAKEFLCTVVHETVRICLYNRRTAGFNSKATLVVKCDQDECQYVGENRLPCPLSLSMFNEEIKLREEKARRYREESEYR